ncbi:MULTISPECIES: LysR substrate-binding domain-containing protein [Thalassobaculum]|uniref:LysR family transcriptional regulator, hydrogen peroxide-inducible genes activator n=1 Tax=Thalassobaculum litoreum DSM 18839 TaxID=1123362 RepID=A0A8G2EYB4_9PROT|nr:MULTISPECIES: LysR substrate-binding domain-containing protein [Thalassobaculum]SDG50254.1 LysR family transcriptional regulator, hydrogen peroxide-inducible genes activator [Thalassobaculum litoreum DSM 18839]
MSTNGLSLRELEYLVAVSEHGHFGRAAEACHVSQPSLSAGVRKVEELLGFRVFERTSRTVLLTRRGAVAVDRARQTIAAAEHFLSTAPASGNPLSGRFVIGAIATIGPYLFRHVLGPLRREHPDLDLIIEEGLTGHLIDRLREGALDAVILSPPVADEGLVIEPCYRERFHLAEAAGDPLPAGPANLAALDMQGAVLLEEGHCLRDQTLSICSAAGIRPRQTAMSLETLKAIVAAGTGFSLIPETATDDTLGGLIRYRPFSDPRIGRTVALAWRRSRTEDDDVRSLLALLRRASPPGAIPIEGARIEGFDNGRAEADNRAVQKGGRP